MIPGILGPNEVILIASLILLIFGADKLPKLARSAGKSIGEFKKARKKSELELKEIERRAGKSGARVIQKERPKIVTGTDEIVWRESKSILSNKKVFLLVLLLVIAVLVLISYIITGI